MIEASRRGRDHAIRSSGSDLCRTLSTGVIPFTPLPVELPTASLTWWLPRSSFLVRCRAVQPVSSGGWCSRGGNSPPEAIAVAPGYHSFVCSHAGKVPLPGVFPCGSPQVLAPRVLAVDSALHYCALRPVCCRWVSNPGTLPALWRLGSNPRPPACKAGALPIELSPHVAGHSRDRLRT